MKFIRKNGHVVEATQASGRAWVPCHNGLMYRTEPGDWVVRSSRQVFIVKNRDFSREYTPADPETDQVIQTVQG